MKNENLCIFCWGVSVTNILWGPSFAFCIFVADPLWRTTFGSWFSDLKYLSHVLDSNGWISYSPWSWLFNNTWNEKYYQSVIKGEKLIFKTCAKNSNEIVEMSNKIFERECWRRLALWKIMLIHTCATCKSPPKMNMCGFLSLCCCHILLFYSKVYYRNKSEDPPWTTCNETIFFIVIGREPFEITTLKP